MRMPTLKNNIISKRLSPPQILALGFTLIILIGAVLLCLPVSTHGSIHFIDAWFTSTSATMVTGLTVVDTGTTFTLFGQIVILCLIQVGGLSFMSFAVLIIMVLGRKVGLRQRVLIQQALSQDSLGGVVRLVRILLIYTLVTEGVAVLFLALYWIPKMGVGQGLYYSIFHVISAFNNAGFSLWSDSLMRFVGDPVVNLIIMVLFVTGGLGFTVIYDIWFTKEFKNLTLHTKLMIAGTIGINIIAVLLFFLLEYTNPGTLGHLSLFKKFLASIFQGLTPRSAGFNTVDISEITDGTAIITSMLMFIGAGSGSTASGIKLTTFLVIILAVIAFIRGRDNTVAFGRTIRQGAIMRAISIVIISLTVFIVALIILSITENQSFIALLFEVASALGTCGLSMGITSELTITGKIIVIVLMFFGRVGPLTLAFSLATPKKDNIRFPNGDVFTG